MRNEIEDGIESELISVHLHYIPYFKEKEVKKMTMTPLTYLMKQLGMTAKDWTQLSEDDKLRLKEMAQEEMDVLGI